MIIKTNTIYKGSKHSLVFIHSIRSCDEKSFTASVTLSSVDGRLFETGKTYKIYYDSIKHWVEIQD